MKSVEKPLIIFLLTIAIITIAGGSYYKIKKNSKEIEKEDVTKVVIKSKEDYQGQIGAYTYEIRDNCSSAAVYREVGYNIGYLKMLDSPAVVTISSGEFYLTRIKEISIIDDNLTILVDSTLIDSLGISATCVELYKNNTTPYFENVTIKNDDREYEEFDSRTLSYSIGSKGTVSNSNVKYSILKDCGSYTKRDLTNRGYYIDTVNDVNPPYWYLITVGKKPNGCYGMKVDNIRANSNNINITISTTEADPYQACSQAIVYPYLCVKLENQGNKNVIIEERIDDDLIEVLQPLN